MLVLELPANPSGMAFFKDAQGVIEAQFPEGSELVDIGDDEALLGKMAGRGKAKAIRLNDGSLAAVFLPIRLKDGSDEGSPSNVAAGICHQLLLQKLDPALLESDYPIRIPSENDPPSLRDGGE